MTDNEQRRNPFLEIGAIIALSTASLYALGFIRQTAYFGHFGIDFHSLGWSAHEVMASSWEVVLPLLFYILLAPISPFSILSKGFRDDASGVYLSDLLSYIVFWVILGSFWGSRNTAWSVLIVVLALIFLVMIDVHFDKQISMRKDFAANKKFQGSLLIASLLLVCVFFWIKGKNEAIKLTSNTAEQYQLSISGKRSESGKFNGKTFAKIGSSDENLFFLALNSEKDSVLSVYVVPIGKLKYFRLDKSAKDEK